MSDEVKYRIDGLGSLRERMVAVYQMVSKGLGAGPVEVVLRRPGRTLGMNAKYHAMIADIHHQAFRGYSFDGVKAVLVNQFALEMDEAGTPLRNPGERGLDLGGNALQFIGNMAEMGEQMISDKLGGFNPGVIGGESAAMRERGYEPDLEVGGYGLDFTTRANPEDTGTGLTSAGQAVEDVSLGYQPNYTIDRALDNPSLKTLSGAAAEQGPAALADMAGLVINAPAYLAARTQEIGEARVQNDEREGMPEGRDYAVAGPTAAASVLLDRFALGKLLPGGGSAVTKARHIPGAVGRAAGTESVTEAIQEGGIEYAGESVGTEAGWNPTTAARRAAGGVIVGGPTGGAVRAGSAAVELKGNRPATESESGPESDAGQAAEDPSDTSAGEPSPGAEQANREAMEAAAELIQTPRFELSSAEREARDSIIGGDALQALRSMGETRGNADAVAELDAASEEASAALEDETLARSRGDTEAIEGVRQRLAGASRRFSNAISMLNGQQESNQQSAKTEGASQMPPTPEWEAAWQEQGVKDPYANLPDTTIDIERAAADTDVNPTPAQAEAGNYRKGRVRLNGFEIAIENPKGSKRNGTDAAGNAWENRMGGHYGDIKGTEGADGDNLDVFVGENPSSTRVFVVDQVAEDGSFDETKTLMGYDSLEDAQQAYLSSYEEGWQGIGEITETTMGDFRRWVREGNTRAPFAMPQEPPSADAGMAQGDNRGGIQGADDSGAQKRKETTFLPDNTPVETEFRVVDLADLTPSNRADGQINPAFPAELQPRDRTNANSQVQVSNIAARLNPERLGSSPDAGTGAPIIGNDGVVESGNGRTMAIANAYKQGGQRAQQYREYVQQQAQERGIEANTDGMRRPVLVRERATEIDRAEFARRSNESQVAGMTSYEQAMADADAMSADDLGAWTPDQSGDPLAASNRDFQRSFVSRLGNNEAARYTTRRGQAAPELGQRMSRAVFAKAYDAPDMVEMVTEQGDQMRNLAGALQTAAPDFAISRETGNQEAAETIEAVNEAVRLVRASRREGVSIRELTEQADAFSDPVPSVARDLAMLINTNMRSRATLENALSYVASDARRRAESAFNGALFEDTTTSEDAIREGFKQSAEVEGGAPGGLEADASGRPGESEREPAARREASDTQGTTEAEAVTLRPDGTPFQTKRAAELSKAYRETPGAVAVEADGGWGFTVPAEDSAPLLEAYTEQDLAQREQDIAMAEQADANQARQEAERAKADRAADDFLLTGSDSAADEAAAQGQQDLMGPQSDDTPRAATSVSVDQQMRGRTGSFNKESGIALEPTPQQVADQVEMLKRARMGKAAERRAIANQAARRNKLVEQASEKMTQAQSLLDKAEQRRRQKGGGATTAQSDIRAGSEAMDQAKATLHEAVKTDAFIRALEQRANVPVDEQQSGIRPTGDTRYAFAGERAQGANQRTLNEAKERIKAGDNAETVRQETGWFQGAEKRWRFEISDDQASLLPAIESLKEGSREAASIDRFSYRQLENGTYNIELFPRDAQTTSDIIKLVGVQREIVEAIMPSKALEAIDEGRGVDEWGGMMDDAGLTVRDAPFEFGGYDALPLDQVLDHPRLFSAYPQLGDLPVQVDPSMGMGAAFVENGDGSMAAIRLGRSQNLSSLLHEIQHGIQNIEGFARGGSPDSVASTLRANILSRAKDRGDDALLNNYRQASRALSSHAQAKNIVDMRNVTQAKQVMGSSQWFEHRDNVVDAFGEPPARGKGRLQYAQQAGARIANILEQNAPLETLDVLADYSFRRARDPAARNQDNRRRLNNAYRRAENRFNRLDKDHLRNAWADKNEAEQLNDVGEQEAMGLYRRLYGEAEARNVQARQGMTEAERKATPVSETQDIADSEAIILMNGQEMSQSAPGIVESVPAADIAEAIKGAPELSDTTVIQSHRDLPPETLMSMALQGVNPRDVRGMYANGELYVIADNVDSVQEGVRTAVHEAVGHKGMRAVLGEDLEPVMRQLYSRLPHSQEGRSSLEEVLRDYPFLDRNNPDDQLTIAEEMVAHLVEKGHRPSAWQRVVAKIKELLRKLFPGVPWTTNDVLGLGEKSRARLRKEQAKRYGGSGDRYSLRGSQAGSYGQDDSTNFSMPDERLRDAALRKMADKMRPLKILQDEIKRSGRNIEEEADAYLAEELFHGKTEYDLRQLQEQYVEPLADGMAKAKITQAELDEYLYARHAPERNATIAERNPDDPDMQDGGSGMSNAEAAAIIERVANSGKQVEYDRLASLVYGMTRLRRDAIRDGGLEDGDMVDAWEANWQNYVPLKGSAKDEPGRPRTGKGFEVSGRESRTAGGRRTLADSPSSQVIIDANESLIRRRKNEVGQSLLSLVVDHPNTSLWQVFTDESPDTERGPVRVKDPETGRTKIEVRENPVNMTGNQNYFKTKRAGRTYYIKIGDERLMNAMRNVGPENNNVLVRTAGAVTRVMSSMMTSFNPEFMLTNFTRDVQTAMLNLTAEQTRDDGKIKGEKIVAQTARDIGPAMKSALRGMRGKQGRRSGQQEWDQWFKEFQQDGAKTGYFDMKDINAQAKEIRAMVRRADGTTLSHMLKARKKTADFVENLNGAVENGVRLSAYANARRAGISRKKAASLAKNMTVNFNRRGEAGTALNSAYMFANASIQGSMNFARTMVTVKNTPEGKSPMNVWARTNTAQKIAFGMASGAFMIGMLNRWASEEDEDGVLFYDKVPDHVKERNIVLMSSLWGGEKDDYIKIPLPYGYNVFSVVGTHAEAVAAGTQDPARAATSLGLAILGSFSPIGWEDSESAGGLIAKNLTPTIVRSVVQVGYNEDFADRMIYKEDFPFGTPTPDSSRSMRSTPEAYKSFASFLNELTGGTDNIDGGVDVSPDVMQHLINYYGGGAWGFVEKSADFAKRKASGEEVERYRVPFSGRFASGTSPYRDQSLFYERMDDLGQIAEEADSLKGREGLDYRRDNMGRIRLFKRGKHVRKQLTDLRKRMDKVKASDNLGDDTKKRRVEMLEKQMKRRVDEFNRRYNDIEEG